MHENSKNFSIFQVYNLIMINDYTNILFYYIVENNLYISYIL